MRPLDKLLWLILPAFTGCATLSPISGGGHRAQPSTFPPYVRPVSEFLTVLSGTISVTDKENKAPFSGATVVMMQPTPPGYIRAQHPTIKNYEMQRISQQRFYVDDKELPFIAKPTKSDVGYWTLGKEASAGWDTNVLVFKPANGARSISIRAIYEGANGIATYLPETRTSRSLSDQDRTEFLRLEDEGYTHTSKPELDRVLKKNGLLRGAGEPDVDYALRFARWMKNIKYELNGGGQDDIANSIENKVSGNCNQFAGLETFALRSQGIPARMPSGYAGDNRDQHVLCEFYCEKTGCWYRMPMSTNETDPRKVFGYDVEQTLVFQIDTTFWPEYSLPVMVEGTGSSNGCGEWMVYEGGEFQFAMQANYDKARSWSKAFSR